MNNFFVPLVSDIFLENKNICMLYKGSCFQISLQGGPMQGCFLLLVSKLFTLPLENLPWKSKWGKFDERLTFWKVLFSCFSMCNRFFRRGQMVQNWRPLKRLAKVVLGYHYFKFQQTNNTIRFVVRDAFLIAYCYEAFFNNIIKMLPLLVFNFP